MLIDGLFFRVVPGHKNWKIETAVWNLTGFFTVG